MKREMNPVERVRRTIAGEITDRVPVVALIIHHALRLSGVRYDEYARNPRLLVDTQVRCWQTYGYDGFHVTCDNWVLASSLGCPIQFFPDQPPTAVRRILAGSKNLNLLTCLKTGKEGRLGFKVEATRLAAEAVGDRCYLKTCFDSGPFSLAASLRGIERLMLDCIEDPQFVLDLLEICTDAVVRFARACGQAGCHALTFGDSTAGLLSRDLYRQFAYPYAKRVVAALADLEIPIFMHICGDTAHIIDLMAATRATGLEVDYQHDIAFYKWETGNGLCLQGNLAPSAVMYRGTTDDVEKAARVALAQGMPSGKFILSAGCEIPRDTPSANIHTLVKAARQYGRYPQNSFSESLTSEISS